MTTYRLPTEENNVCTTIIGDWFVEVGECLDREGDRTGEICIRAMNRVERRLYAMNAHFWDFEPAREVFLRVAAYMQLGRSPKGSAKWHDLGASTKEADIHVARFIADAAEEAARVALEETDWSRRAHGCEFCDGEGLHDPSIDCGGVRGPWCH